MIRYEATIDGNIEPGEPFVDFKEQDEFFEILKRLGWSPKPTAIGRGGYYQYEISTDFGTKLLNVYLKRITFGGRANRPQEKRAQFSAALDRKGYEFKDVLDNKSVIIGLYRREPEKFDDVIICAWRISDWGHNIGRAFNCFIDIKTIAEAIRDGVAQHKTSIGQIAYAFKPEKFPQYLKHLDKFHKNLLSKESLNRLFNDEVAVIPAEEHDTIPKFDALFQPIIEVLRRHDGVASVATMEEEVGKDLYLSEYDLYKIHNKDEGYRTELGYRLAWARFYLKKAGLIESPKRGIWSLTALGFNTIEIDENLIKRIATEREFKKAEKLSTIEVDEEGVELEQREGSSIAHPFDPNKVDIRTRSMSLDLLLKRMRTDAIDMTTSFQRRAGIWGFTKKSRLIESILIRIPLPVFYFDGSNDEKWLVVDGLQRLSTLDEFVNRQSFALQGLEFLTQFNDKRFVELPNYLQRRIEEFEITAYVISPGTPKELKFNIFKRINTTGLTLTAQEIRNALYPEKSREILERLAGLRSFKIATTYSISEERMLHKEFILRFLAFRLFGEESYPGDLDAFLNNTMEEIDKQGLKGDAIERHFDKAMNAAIEIFGDFAFRKQYEPNGRRYPINKALFEVWSVLLSRLNDAEIQLLIQRREQLNHGFISLLNTDDDFNSAVTSGTGDKSSVRKRFEAINVLIQSTLG